MAIKDFYYWLEQNLSQIFEDTEIQHEVSKRLAEIDPKLRWEVGPWKDSECFFAFSPSLNRDLLTLTEKLAANAPETQGWTFLPSKPRKNWKRRNIKTTFDGQKEEVNFDNWRYYLLSFNDGEFFDVNLIPPKDCNKPVELLEHFGDLFVQFELGEKMFMDLIDRVNIIDPSECEEETYNVEDLFDHIKSTT
ncbi:MAG: hypothetical protein OQJ89_01545 [Kangiellaceae bacterium]|nr:hypothetical protein [Kangiellaceae bacterium]MCW8999155.1 hypothetical protein [Kangiellaceae bacterium]MCW9015627.1 hypothetical protein [Kangiellaceae bacterium]